MVVGKALSARRVLNSFSVITIYHALFPRQGEHHAITRIYDELSSRLFSLHHSVCTSLAKSREKAQSLTVCFPVASHVSKQRTVAPVASLGHDLLYHGHI